MILRLGFREFRRDLLLNLIVILQMSVMLLIGLTAVSSVESRFTYYTPFAHYFRQDGLVCAFRGPMAMRAEDCEQLLGMRAKVDMEYMIDAEFINYNVHVVDDGILQSFMPELTEGRFVMHDTAAEYPQAIAPANKGYHVGDIVAGYGTPDAPCVQISGLYAEDTRLPVFNQHRADERNFRMLYGTAEELSSGTAMILSRAEAQKIDGVLIPIGLAFITYPDGADDAAIKEDMKLLGFHGMAQGINNSEFAANSLRYVYGEVIALIPVLTGVLILLVISMVSVNAVSTQRQLHSYAVYRLGGLTWQGCGEIAAVKACFVSGAALLLTAAVIAVKPHIPFLLGFYLSFGIPQAVCVIAIILLNVTVSAAISTLVLHRAKINQTLKEV